MPASKPAETRQRRNKTSTHRVLSTVVDHKVPPMPSAADWLKPPLGLSKTETAVWLRTVRWSPHVVKWWETLWSSPMSNEYHDSDTTQLYLACYYLELAVDPALKPGERLQSARQHENCVKQFGLSPMSRRSLQWEIARADEATAAGREKARKRQSVEQARTARTEAEIDPRASDGEDGPNPFHVVGDVG